MFGSEQSCIGESLMRKECVSGFIGGKQSLELAVAEYHERMVMKAVAVIVHVGAVEKEGGIACLFYMSIPNFLVCFAVSFYLKHVS